MLLAYRERIEYIKSEHKGEYNMHIRVRIALWTFLSVSVFLILDQFLSSSFGGIVISKYSVKAITVSRISDS